MSAVSDIIENAFQESALLNELQSATPTQTSQALARLQNIVTAAYGFEVGEPLVDWPLGLEGVQFQNDMQWDATKWQRPRINARLIAASTAAQTVYLPERPYDGSRVALIDPASRLAAAPITVDGNGRTVEGAATFVANVNGLQKIWFYRADLGNWTSLTPLTFTDPFPFPLEFDEYFTSMLAMRLNPRYGRSMDEQTAVGLQRSLSMLQARYKQSENVSVDTALLNLAQPYSGMDYARPYFNGDRGWMG